MTGAPITADLEPENDVPFPEPLAPQEIAEVDIGDSSAVEDRLEDIVSFPLAARAEPFEDSLYYDASSMAPLNPLAAVSSFGHCSALAHWLPLDPQANRHI